MPPIPAPTPATWPLDRIAAGENCRLVPIDDGIRELLASIQANGLLQPLLVQEPNRLIAGFRRHAALKLGGIQTVSVMVYPASLTPSQIKVINLTENLQRVDLTDPQIYASCKELVTLNPEWARKDLAAHLSKDGGTVTRYLCPDDLIPEALKAFMEGEFGFSVAYTIARSPDQLCTLNLRRNGGATRDELARSVKKKSAAPAVKSAKIVCPLVSGAKVTVAGEELSLEEAIEAMGEAVKLAKAALAKGLNAKTAMAVWRDVSVAG